jgi:hypothetical protein
MGLPTKKSGEFLVHLSSSASQAVIGAAGVSTKAMKERPRNRIAGGRTAIALVTTEPRTPSMLAGRIDPISAHRG